MEFADSPAVASQQEAGPFLVKWHRNVMIHAGLIMFSGVSHNIATQDGRRNNAPVAQIRNINCYGGSL